MTHSIDFRGQVLKVKEIEGLNFAAASERFKIGKNTLFVWSKKIEPKRNRNKPATKLDMAMVALPRERFRDLRAPEINSPTREAESIPKCDR